MRSIILQISINGETPVEKVYPDTAKGQSEIRKEIESRYSEHKKNDFFYLTPEILKLESKSSWRRTRTDKERLKYLIEQRDDFIKLFGLEKPTISLNIFKR